MSSKDFYESIKEKLNTLDLSEIKEFVYNLMYDKGMLNDSAIAAAMDMAYFEEFSPDELPIIISKGDEVIFEMDESVLADIK